MTENGVLSAVSSTSQTGLHLSLFTPGPLVQVGIAATVSVLVLTATAATFTMVVTRSQFTPPAVKPDVYTTNKITTKIFSVLDNERDTERNAQLTITKVDQPLYGTAKISADKQTIEYTSPYYYAGTFSFNYTAANDKLDASTSVTVTVLNKPPTGVDQVYAILKNSKDNAASVFGSTLSKDKCYDVDDDKMKIVSIDSTAKYGVASISSDLQKILYTPNKDSLDTEVISYTFSDFNDTATAKVTFTVSNSAPIANPDVYTVRQNTVNNFDILANDYDANNDDLKIIRATSTKYGRVIISENQKLVKYVPEIQGPIVDSFQYTISDGSLTSSSYVIVRLVNENPRAADSEITVPKNSKNNAITLLYDDSDPFTTLSVSITKSPTNGNLNFTRSETKLRRIMYPNEPTLVDLAIEFSTYSYSVQYTPKPFTTYSDSFTFLVDDNNGGKASANVVIHVANLPPVANPDTITVEKNVRYSGINVLTNDIDPNDDQIELVSTTPSTQLGTTLIELQKVTYIPPNNYVGVDTFRYTIRDVQDDPNAVKTAEGLVTVNVVNTPPVAVDDSYVVPKGRVTVLDVLQNDYDKNQDKLTITQVGGSSLASTVKIITETVNGVSVTKLEYSAQDGLTSNPDRFTYTISDGIVTASATVTVQLKNDPPTANDDTATLVWRKSVTVDVVDNDTDPNNGDKAKLVVSRITSNPGSGTVTFSGKTITYTPNLNFVGVDTLKYKVKDEYDESNDALVTITVTNTAPQASNDAYTQLWGTSKVYDVLENDRDADGDSISIKSISTTGTRGTVAIQSGRISYTGGTFSGVDTFTYTITDGNKDSTATVTVTNTNTPPKAVNDVYTLHWRSAGSIFNVLDNDSDADLNPLTISSVGTTGTKGTVTINSGRTITYNAPTTPTVGTDTFTYTITDNVDSATATVTVTLVNPNTPSAPNLSATYHWKTTGTTFTSVSNDKDQDGDTLTVSISQAPTKGTATVSGKDIRYTQNSGVTGRDTLKYTVSDGQTSAEGTITIDIVNAQPTAQATTVTTVWNRATSGVDVNIASASLIADTDVADTLTISQISPTTHSNGNSVLLNGKVTFTPAQGFVGSHVVTYTVTDGNLSASNTITFIITNNKPVGTTKLFSVHWSSQSTGSLFDVFTNLSDADGDTISLTGVTVSANGAVALVDNGNKKVVRFTQTLNWIGTTTFTVTFTDGWESNTQLFSVEVRNAVPTASAVTASVHWRSNIVIDVLATASDSDSQDTVSLKSVSNLSAGGSAVISNGKVLYNPKQPYVGTETFSFTATDGLSDVSRTVTVTVTNTLPVAVTDNVVLPWSQAKNGQTINAKDNDSDGNLDPISIISITQPSVGAAVLLDSSLGRLSYTLANPTFTDAFQSTSFTYTLSDVAGTSTGTVNVQITNNDRPTATDQTFTIHWSRASFRIDVLSTTKDNDGDTLSLTVQQISGSPLTGTAQVKVDTSSGISYIDFQRANGFKGTEVFNYIVSDGLASATGKITINVVNAIPTAQNFNRVLGTTQTTGLLIDVLSSAADSDAQDSVSLTSVTQPTSGTGTSSIEDKKVRYVQPNGYEGLVTFQYTVTDGLDSVTRTISITVTNKNKVYTLHWSTQTAGSSLFVMQGIVATSGGAQLELSTTQDGNAPTSGTYTVQTVNGLRTHVLYRQNANYLGEDSFQLKYVDGSSIVPITVFITIYNTKPLALAKTATTHWNTPVVIDCLAGATDADAPLDTVSLSNTLVQPSSGTVSIQSGKVNFTPSSSSPIVGTVTFSYSVTDQLLTDTQTGTITLTNRPPSTTPKSFSIQWREHRDGKIINVRGSDSDPDGDTLTILSISTLSKATAGTVTLNPDRTVTVKAATSGPLFFNDVATFTYRISDGVQSVTETVTVTITNRRPVTVDDVSNIKWSDSNVQIDVLANDSDPDGDTLTLQTVASSQGGTVTISGNKAVYTPPTRFVGTDIVTYTITDGAETTTGKLTVNVGNTAPVGKDYTISSHWKTIGTKFQFNVVADTTDVEGNTITLKSTSNLPIQSQGVVTSNNGVITFTPTKGFVGTATFQFTVTDSIYDSTKTISCTVTNNAPTASFTTVNVLWTRITGGQLINVIPNLSDSNNDTPLTLLSEGLSPSRGTAVIESVSGVQQIRYTPTQSGYLGADAFTVVFEDGWTKNSAVLNINIFNTLPTAPDKTASVHWRSTTGVTVDAVTGSSDVDGNTVTLDSIFGTYVGTATRSGNNIVFVPSPSNVVIGSQVVQFRLSDGIQTIQKMLTVSVTNTLPVVSSITLSSHWKVLLNTGVTIDLLAGATDSNGDTLTVTSITTPTKGTAVLNADKRNVLFRITSASDRNSQSTFSFIVSDGAQTVTRTVTININNALPTAVNDIVSVTATNPQTKQLINILGNDFDTDTADTLSLVGTPTYTGSSSVAFENGRLAYTAPNGFLGTETITYKITDGADEATATVTVTVSATRPVANPDSASMQWNAVATVNALSNDSGTSISIDRIKTNPTSGVATLSNNVISYRPNPSVTYTSINNGVHSLVDTFTYTIRDIYGQTADGTISITVSNTAPVAVNDALTFAKSVANPFQTINVLANDQLQVGETVSVSLTTPTRGTASWDSVNRVMRYQPNVGYSGSDSFTYTISDSQLTSTATVSITVTNAAPTGNNVNRVIAKGTNELIDVLTEGSFSDANGDSLTVSIVSFNNAISGVVIENNRIRYTAIAGRSPNQSTGTNVTFRVSDGTTSIDRILNVRSPNNNPTAAAITRSYNKNSGTQTISMVSSISDVDVGDVPRVDSFTDTNSCLGAAKAGTITLSNNVFTYVQTTGYVGSCTITYSVTDQDVDNPRTATSTLTLTSLEKPIVANDDSVQFTQNVAGVIRWSDILANDSYDSFESGTLVIEIDTTASRVKGTNDNTNKQISYSPGNTCQNDYLNYRIKYTSGATSNWAKITIQIVCQTCSNKADIVFVIDGSGSITGTNWSNLLVFLGQLVDTFTVGQDNIKIGIVQFANSQTRVELDLSNSQTSVKSKITSLSQLSDNTPTLIGIEKGFDILKNSVNGRSGVPKVMAILTDGLANDPCNCANCLCDVQAPCGTSFNQQVPCTTRLCNSFSAFPIYCKRNANIGGSDRWNTGASQNCVGQWVTGGTSYCVGSIPSSNCAQTSWIIVGSERVCPAGRINFCYSCSNPHIKAAEINAMSGYKVVAMAIGSDLLEDDGRGIKYVRKLNYDESKTIIVDWNDLATVKNELLSQVCNTN